MFAVSSSVIRNPVVRVALSAAMVASVAPAQAELMIGLTNNALVFFDSASPASASAPIAVTGLAAGSTLIGFDVRPTTGVPYAVANDGAIYALNGATGAATMIGVVAGGIPGGSGVGIDFNPVPDLAGQASLRITTTASNVRFNVNPGSIGTTVDGNINGATTFLDGLAYTNNDRDPATGTMLFGIGGGNLYQVTTPNAGTSVLIGSLGVTSLVGATGFDVSALTGSSYASLTNAASGLSSFYTVDLTTGAATLVGAFGANVGLVRDITAFAQAPPVAAIPEPETYAMMLLGLAGIGWAARRRRR